MARPARAAAAPAEPAPAPALSVPTPFEPPAPAVVAPDLFDMAFAEAAAAETEPKPVEAVQPKTPTGAPKPPETSPAEPVQTPQPAEPAPIEPEPVQPPAPVQPPQPQPPYQPPPQPPPQPQPQAQVPRYQEPPLFSPEEVTQLQSFYSEWPDVANATETMIKGLVAQTVRRMYADMASSMAPYFQMIDTLADRSQLSELQTHVSDYDTVAGQLTSWAANQPAYLRSAYEHVIKSGTAAEVVDLINRYKQDMQSTMPAHSAQRAQPAPSSASVAPISAPAPAPVNPALAAAAARLAPVSTKRTNVVAPPADFDTAFAEFAKAS